MTKFLTRKGYSPVLISRALKELQDAAGDQSVNLYDLNKQTYKKLRYGVKVSEAVGQHKITVQFVDWEHPLENDFYIAEEVTIKHKRPDLVLYINGIAFAVIELKRSTVSMSEGIRQSLTNQRPDMIMQFLRPLGWSWRAMIRRGRVTALPVHRKSIIFPGKKIPMPKMRFPQRYALKSKNTLCVWIKT